MVEIDKEHSVRSEGLCPSAAAGKGSMRVNNRHRKAFSLQMRCLQRWGRVSWSLDFRAFVSCTSAVSAALVGSEM